MALPFKYNLRNLTVRKGTTLATAASIGLTVAVFLMVMALARGIDLTLETSGEPLNLLVVRNGSTSELSSNVSRENLDTIKFLDGVAREGDQPLASPELVTLIYRARKGQTQGSNVTMRGSSGDGCVIDFSCSASRGSVPFVHRSRRDTVSVRSTSPSAPPTERCARGRSSGEARWLTAYQRGRDGP